MSAGGEEGEACRMERLAGLMRLSHETCARLVLEYLPRHGPDAMEKTKKIPALEAYEAAQITAITAATEVDVPKKEI